MNGMQCCILVDSVTYSLLDFHEDCNDVPESGSTPIAVVTDRGESVMTLVYFQSVALWHSKPGRPSLGVLCSGVAPGFPVCLEKYQ